MSDKALTAPSFLLTLPEADLDGGFAVTYISSQDEHCDTCRIYPDDEVLDEIGGTDVSDCLVEMGMDEDFDELLEGAGSWEKNGSEILIRDNMVRLLETSITATFLGCHPQEVLRYILTLAGVEKYVLAQDEFPAKPAFTVDTQNACEAIKQMNSAWGLDTAFFYWGDTFYWGTAPEQEEVYELNDQNVLDMEKEGEKWTADIIGVPWLHHSQVVIVDHEKLIGVGEITKVVIRSSGEGFCDMYVEFKEVPANG